MPEMIKSLGKIVPQEDKVMFKFIPQTLINILRKLC